MKGNREGFLLTENVVRGKIGVIKLKMYSKARYFKVKNLKVENLKLSFLNRFNKSSIGQVFYFFI